MPARHIGVPDLKIGCLLMKPVMPARSAMQCRMNCAIQCGISLQMALRFTRGILPVSIKASRQSRNKLPRFSRYQTGLFSVGCVAALPKECSLSDVPVICLQCSNPGVDTGFHRVGDRFVRWTTTRRDGHSAQSGSQFLASRGNIHAAGNIIGSRCTGGRNIPGLLDRPCHWTGAQLHGFYCHGGLRVSLTASALIYGIAGIGIILLIAGAHSNPGGCGEHHCYLQAGARPSIAFTLVAALLVRYSCCSFRPDMACGNCNTKAIWR